jgi:hypothetical protein
VEDSPQVSKVALTDSGFSRVITKDECFLLPIWSGPYNHLGSSFILMLANHGLSACSVLRMCVIGCGEGFSSHVDMPVSTPSITIHGHGLSLLMSFIGIGCLVRKWEMDMVCGSRSAARCPSHVRRMQFPARLHVTPAIRTFCLFSARVLLTLVNILALSIHSLIGGGEVYIIINLLG